MKYCQECGAKSTGHKKFCGECGYKLVISEVVEDKKGYIRHTQEIIESESPIEIPKKLTLMPGEKLLERHMDFYVSNKRIVKHKETGFNNKTIDYHYRHIKGLQESSGKPFLLLGLVIGIIFLFVSPLIGIGIIILAFWFKKTDLKVLHMDGGFITIPNIKSEKGQRVASILRTQLYQK